MVKNRHLPITNKRNRREELAQKTVMHKGYHGTIKVNTKDYSLFGKILFIDEEMNYSGQSFAELEENFP